MAACNTNLPSGGVKVSFREKVVLRFEVVQQTFDESVVDESWESQQLSALLLTLP